MHTTNVAVPAYISPELCCHEIAMDFISSKGKNYFKVKEYPLGYGNNYYINSEGVHLKCPYCNFDFARLN